MSARLTERELRRATASSTRRRATAVGDSGIWQHLQAPSLPVADLATLVGATSDNLATNVLLRQVGLRGGARPHRVARPHCAPRCSTSCATHRGPDDAPQLSVGSTAELTWLFAALARGEIVDSLDVSQRVLGWLSLNSDLSMVAERVRPRPARRTAAPTTACCS